MNTPPFEPGDIVSWHDVGLNYEDTRECTVDHLTLIDPESGEWVVFLRWRTETSRGEGATSCDNLKLLSKAQPAKEKLYTSAEVGKLVENLARSYWVPGNTRLGFIDPYPSKEIAYLSGAWASQVVRHLKED